MKATRLIFGLAAIIWWISCIKNGIEFFRLAAALGLTLSWFLTTVAIGAREYRQMTRRDRR